MWWYCVTFLTNDQRPHRGAVVVTPPSTPAESVATGGLKPAQRHEKVEAVLKTQGTQKNRPERVSGSQNGEILERVKVCD